ncbi:MAG: cytochrome c [Verrucomicrobia bacterium]|nr:cytochrome c [Verrucomicrobiota bacterium]
MRTANKSDWTTWRIVWAVLLAVGAGCVIAAEMQFSLPPETNRFKPGAGSEIAATQCIICHSADYISTQPPMPRAFWKAGVQKMQKVYGAPIPEEQVEPLVDYLVKNYGNEKPRSNAPPAAANPAK